MENTSPSEEPRINGSRIALIILKKLFGALFIASAVLKLFPVEAFEMVLIRQAGFSWDLAPYAARLLVIFEGFLGLSIIFGFQTLRMLWLSMLMLAAFDVFLIIQMVTGAGAENCGCFGELLPMDAPTSLGKNLVFMAIASLLIWKQDAIKFWRLPWIAPVLSVIAIPVVFLLFPIPVAEFDAEATVSDSLIEHVNETQEWDLSSDKKLIVVVYAKCVHCKQLATLLSTLSAEEASERLRILIFGEGAAYTDFIDETGIKHLPHQRTYNRALMQGINGTFPSAILVQNGKVLHNWTGRGVNMDMMSSVLSDEYNGWNE